MSSFGYPMLAVGEIPELRVAAAMLRLRTGVDGTTWFGSPWTEGFSKTKRCRGNVWVTDQRSPYSGKGL